VTSSSAEEKRLQVRKNGQPGRNVHVIKVFKDHLQLDPRFDLDFNTAFPTGIAVP
jgi:hypothetical protein